MLIVSVLWRVCVYTIEMSHLLTKNKTFHTIDKLPIEILSWPTTMLLMMERQLLPN